MPKILNLYPDVLSIFVTFMTPQPGGEMAEYDLVGVIIAKNGLKTPKMRILRSFSKMMDFGQTSVLKVVEDQILSGKWYHKLILNHSIQCTAV